MLLPVSWLAQLLQFLYPLNGHSASLAGALDACSHSSNVPACALLEASPTLRGIAQ